MSISPLVYEAHRAQRAKLESEISELHASLATEKASFSEIETKLAATKADLAAALDRISQLTLELEQTREKIAALSAAPSKKLGFGAGEVAPKKPAKKE